ncbi:MAG TPA: LamG domain-containing protein [Candidatus Paceibacterota bacterium]|nr:LamG domain-containing protein [Candidatus Paceibacterota bacterium]
MEVLITVAIITSVSLVGFVAFSKYKGSQAIELTMSELAAVVRDTQKRAVTQEDGKAWGVRFSNASSSYQVFSGSSYASGTVARTYYLGRNVFFGNPATSTVDALFSAITGKLSETRVISLVNTKKDGVVGDIILTSRGAITTRKDSGLIGYWHLDENTATTTYDSSGFANIGTVNNGAVWETSSNCRAGNCLSFDGSNDYVRIPDSSSLNVTGNAFTVTAWVYRTAAANWQRIVGKYFWTGVHTGSWLLFFNDANQTLCQFNTGSWSSAQSTATVSLNQWTFVACVYNGSNLVNYVNNASTSVSKTGNIISSNYPVAFAVTTDGTNIQNGFTGRIDEVRIYNRALSDSEISNLYNDLK